MTESVGLYTKTGDTYNHIEDVDPEFFKETLQQYIKLGSILSAGIRKTVKTKLAIANGDIGDNVNCFQNYITEGEFELTDSNFIRGEELLLEWLTNNKAGYISHIINQIYPTASVANYMLKYAWSALPKAPIHGSSGQGELFLAFFGNGYKPQKGDLAIGDRNIELKGAGGRLYKSPVIADDMTNMSLDYNDNDEEFVNKMAETIAVNSGTEKALQYIVELLSDPTVLTALKADYKYFKSKNKLRSGNILMQIGGIAQMFVYKQEQGFDSMICFNNKISNDIYLQFIDFKNINSLVEMYHMVNSLPSHVKTNRHKDGNGFMITVKPK
jgi:hypothetical protein